MLQGEDQRTQGEVTHSEPFVSAVSLSIYVNVIYDMCRAVIYIHGTNTHIVHTMGSDSIDRIRYVTHI